MRIGQYRVSSGGPAYPEMLWHVAVCSATNQVYGSHLAKETA